MLRKLTPDELKKFVTAFRKEMVGDPFFSTIFNLIGTEVEIELNDEIKTARITMKPYFGLKIEISPIFFRKYVKNAYDVMFLLAHEILHHILGHLSVEYNDLKGLYPHNLINFAMDVIINHKLYIKFGRHVNDLKIFDFYTNKYCPHQLLLPPHLMENRGFRSQACRKLQIDVTKDSESVDVRRICKHVVEHHKGEIPYLITKIAELVIKEDIPPEEIDKILKDSGLKKDEDIDYISSGFSEDVEKRGIKKAVSKFKGEVLQAIKEMVSEEEEGGVYGGSRGAGMLPYFSRRDFIFLGNDFAPIIYHGNYVEEELYGVHLYVDVSDSFFDWLPHIFSAVESIKNWISFPIYGFSNKVFPISRRDLLEGKYKTTSGTDFNCFAEHVLKHRFTRLVLITDGYAEITKTNERRLKTNTKILVLLPPSPKSEKECVRRFAWKVVSLDIKSRIVHRYIPQGMFF